MKLIGLLLRLIVVVAIVFWLSESPGTAKIVWHDQVIETSAAVLAALFVLLLYLSLVLYRLWRALRNAPELWGLHRKVNALKEGNESVAKGLAALAAGQSAQAGKFAVKARKLLGQTPVTHLLLAQAAQLAGDRALAKEAFTAMTKDKATAILGYRGLITTALRAGEWQEATRLVGCLEGKEKEIPWLDLVRFELATKAENWQQAEKALLAARKSKSVDSDALKQHEAALLLAQAKDALREAQPGKALPLAEQAHKLRPAWIPASLILAQTQILTGHDRAARRTIERAWNLEPHPQLIDAAILAMKDSRMIDTYKFVEKMTRTTRSNPVALMALAETAYKAHLWGESRRFLLLLVGTGHAPKQAYHLLAQLEQRETGNEHTASQWIVKGAQARPDPTWICTACGALHPEWSPTCPSCGAFNRLDWSVPGQSRPPQENLLTLGQTWT
ncbi:MAG: heme biosynthesis HemY N-terminal domain-containing protein [Bdellovibrionales bacterium]